MENGRDSEVEQELSKLGWTNEVYRDIQVWKEFKQSKNMNEWTIYHRLPVWKWDFVRTMTPYTNPVTGIYMPKRAWDFPSKDSWVPGCRFDFETPTDLTAKEVAVLINNEYEEWTDNPDPKDILWHSEYPIQRVSDRPSRP